MSDRRTAIVAWEALFRAQVTVLRELGKTFPDDLSLTEYDVLFNLSRYPDHRARLRDLNKQLLLTQPSVSRLVDRLSARGLVTKRTDPADGRGTIVTLTEAGYALFREVALVHSGHIHRLLDAALTEDELETLTALTDKLRRSTGG
jgi:DNA-binding MarR family transcriptional regulator